MDYRGFLKTKCELYHDNYENWKRYPIHKAQLIIADVPYNVGNAAFGSNPIWRDKLPKFRNDGKMVFDWFLWEKDGKAIPKIHSTQKPVKVLKRLIEIFTDPGDVVIDPCAGSGSTLRSAYELGRNSYGFEIDREMCRKAREQMLSGMEQDETAEQVSLFS